jgi:hypothetical protein
MRSPISRFTTRFSGSRAAPPAAPRMRAARSLPPQDRAFYRCGCGCCFTDEVTATVRCPHCGAEQAW